jgi:hypothetical protein
MSELNYYVGEFTDTEPHALADAGDYYLSEEGWEYRLTPADISRFMIDGFALLAREGKF